MFCPQCGSKIEQKAQFCPYCGAPLQTSPANPAPQPAPVQPAAPYGQAPQPAPVQPAAPYGQAPQPAPAKSGGKGKVVTIVLAAVAVAVALLAFFVVKGGKLPSLFQADPAVPTSKVSVTINATGYDPSTATPIPLHVEGKDAAGNEVSRDFFATDDIELPSGSYKVTIPASPLCEDGTFYDVTDMSADLTVTDDGGAVEEDIPPYDDPAQVTDEQVEAAKEYADKAGVEQKTVDAYAQTTTDKRDQAIQAAADDEAAKQAEEQAKAASEKNKKTVTDFCNVYFNEWAVVDGEMQWYDENEEQAKAYLSPDGDAMWAYDHAYDYLEGTGTGPTFFSLEAVPWLQDLDVQPTDDTGASFKVTAKIAWTQNEVDPSQLDAYLAQKTTTETYLMTIGDDGLIWSIISM